LDAGTLGKVYQDEEAIVHQGEVGDCMYVIQEGQVEVVVDEDGKEVRLMGLDMGELFEDMGSE
jgi:CRP-like cAMP-binding protein